MSVQIELQGDREVVLTRSFQAPRALVFEALTKPELIQRWNHVNDWGVDVCEIDLRPGGSLRYGWRDAKGRTMGMSGTFLEVSPPDRFVATAVFDEAWYPGQETTTTTLTEKDGVTTMRLVIAYDSTEARAAVLATPAMSGMEQGYQHLEELLGKLAPAH